MSDVGLIIAVLGLIVFTVCARYAAETWVDPCAFFPLCWTFIVLFSLSGPLFGVEHYRVWDGTIWWMTLTMLIMSTGAVIGKHLAGMKQYLERNQFHLCDRDLPFIQSILPACAVAGAIYLVLARPDLSIDHPPFHVQIFLGFGYVAPLLGGVSFAVGESQRVKLIALCTVIPGIFTGFVGMGRTMIILQIQFWIAGYFAMSIYLHGASFRLFTTKRVLLGMICLVFFLAVGAVIQLFRSVERGLPLTDRLLLYWDIFEWHQLLENWEWMHSSIFGHVAMFSWYFEKVWAYPPGGLFGARTMAGLYRVFVGELPPALSTDDIAGISTNVFTIFKPPIEDWTLWGSLVAWFLFGTLSGWAYGKVRNGSLWPIAMLLIYYTNSMIPGGWFLSYNSIAGSYVVIGLYLWLVQKRLDPKETEVHIRFGPVKERTELQSA